MSDRTVDKLEVLKEAVVELCESLQKDLEILGQANFTEDPSYLFDEAWKHIEKATKLIKSISSESDKHS